MATPRRSLRVLGAALAVALVLPACGDDEPDRPSFGAWLPDWQQTRTLEPTLEEAEAGGTDVCGEFLGEVRAQREVLLPTPAEGLDAPVEEWIEEAETIGLDCDREGELADNLEDLTRRADSIDALIEAQTG